MTLTLFLKNFIDIEIDVVESCCVRCIVHVSQFDRQEKYTNRLICLLFTHQCISSSW